MSCVVDFLTLIQVKGSSGNARRCEWFEQVAIVAGQHGDARRVGVGGATRQHTHLAELFALQ